MYDDEDFLLISGIQHFAFCRRQWALMYVETQWAENERTVDGELLHKKAHDPFFTEKRGDLIISRDMPVYSRTLGITGHCDVVEFHKNIDGVELSGRKGRWQPCPVEYKRGRPKKSDADELQLCAQAICLEEMLVCRPIENAYLYYGEPNRREPVILDIALREKVKSLFIEMRGYYDRGYTPRVKQTKACASCSLKDICLPGLPVSVNSVREYIETQL